MHQKMYSIHWLKNQIFSLFPPQKKSAAKYAQIGRVGKLEAHFQVSFL